MQSSTTRRKVAFVTGSGKKRIGSHIVQEAARRGFDVAIHFNTSDAEAQDTAEEARARGVRAEIFQADLADPKATDELCSKVLETFPQVDLLATCGAIWDPVPLSQIMPEDILRNFSINTMATLICCQKIGLAMTKQADGGCIVTLGDWAIERPYPGYLAYFVSKGSIPTMTKALAVELSELNPRVRVNCIHPGPAMVPDSIGETEREKIADSTLVKRLGTPKHISDTVFFLFDNDFISGSTVCVDGGRTSSTR